MSLPLQRHDFVDAVVSTRTRHTLRSKHGAPNFVVPKAERGSGALQRVYCRGLNTYQYYRSIFFV